ncbi:MaoC/PaaZ C-terminal domain-containing protein [Desulfococcaceae bacterium HSG9]|nr:MaoC/PaaZ C-terminal domain-containing protein [Desulfococcaceae bacterium HSG9]
MLKRYFDDLAEGEKPDCADVAFTRNDIIEFAWRFDPQAFHTDEDAAKKSAFGGLIASSLHTLAACTRSVVEAQGDIAVLSGIGMHEVKMFNPVRPGDVLGIDARWCELKQSASKPDRGLASIKCKVINQNKELVIAYGYRYLLACRFKI